MSQLLLGWCIGSALLAIVLLSWSPKWLRGSWLLPLVTALSLAVAAITGLLAATLRTYATLTFEAPVATVRIEAVSAAPKRMRLLYTPLHPPGAPQQVELAGDQWMVSGEILKWHPWLNLLGFRTLHKPTRFSGRFAQAAQERLQPPTVYELNNGPGAVWAWLHQYGQRLPLVEAVYGNSAYTYAQPGRTYTLYVTLSGYLLK